MMEYSMSTWYARMVFTVWNAQKMQQYNLKLIQFFHIWEGNVYQTIIKQGICQSVAASYYYIVLLLHVLIYDKNLLDTVIKLK